MNSPAIRIQLTMLAVAVAVVAGLTYRVVKLRNDDVEESRGARGTA